MSTSPIHSSSYQMYNLGTMAVMSRCSHDGTCDYRNGNVMGMVNSSTAHAQMHDVHTHTGVLV